MSFGLARRFSPGRRSVVELFKKKHIENAAAFGLKTEKISLF